MDNPIPQCNLYDTPTDLDGLTNWCLSLSGSERVIALTAAGMALNYAHHVIAKHQQENA